MIEQDVLRAAAKTGGMEEPHSSVTVRMCFWYVFLIAWQPDDVELAREFGRKASAAWQRVRVLADGDVVDLFSVILAETIVQAFPRVFPGSRSTFDDAFTVFSHQTLFHLLFGIVVAPTAVHEMRSLYHPQFFERTENAGTGGVSEIFESKSPIFLSMAERPVALAKSRSEGFYSKNISTSYSTCAGPDHPTFMTLGGPGTKIPFVPFNVRKVRVKTLPPEEDDEEPPPPPPAPPPPKKLTQSELNEALFKLCTDATTTHHVPATGKGTSNYKK